MPELSTNRQLANGNKAQAVVNDDGSPLGAARAGTATLANVAASASSVTLLAANTGRLGARLHNDSQAALYLKFGADASATSFTELVPAGAAWKLDADGAVYTGIITGVWSSATGAARTTELTS